MREQVKDELNPSKIMKRQAISLTAFLSLLVHGCSYSKIATPPAPSTPVASSSQPTDKSEKSVASTKSEDSTQPTASYKTEESSPSQVKQRVSEEQNVDRTQEVMGNASTGEKVTLMLDSIDITLRSIGFERPTYSFSYQIGAEKVNAVTSCNGEFQTTKDGTFYDNPVKPASAATQKMLDRVCTYRVKAFQVVNLPASVKTEPQGKTLCTVQNAQSITTFGQHQDYAGWFYTNVCGKIGLINRAQIQ